VVAAEAGTLDTPMRRTPRDPWIRLREGTCSEPGGRGIPSVLNRDRPVLCVAYDTETAIRFADYPQCEFLLILKNDRGERHEFGFRPEFRVGPAMGFGFRWHSSRFGPGEYPKGIDKAGEWSLVESPFDASSKTTNMEVYLELIDKTRGQPPGRFKISNSLVVGQIPQITRARGWTKEELARFTTARPKTPPPSSVTGKPPLGPDLKSEVAINPMGLNAAAPAKSRGELLPTVGGTGGGPFRQERPGQPVLGFIHRTGKWAGQDGVAGVTALFSERDATYGQAKTMAKPGYAVGGLNVEADAHLTAMQVVFMKLKPDGGLDPEDQYTSEWIGAPKGEQVHTLGGSGRKIVGIHGRRAAMMDAIGLVAE
jgi:hypothetical protein